MRDAIGFENLQNFRYLYAPKHRCTNDFTAIYEERMVRMLHHMRNIFRDNVSSSGYRGLQLDKKRRKELQEWKIALGHREDDHEDPANYPTQSY